MENKFSVRFFNSVDNAVVEIVKLPNVEQAVQFALNLHQSSNVPHEVIVSSLGDSNRVLVLIKR